MRITFTELNKHMQHVLNNRYSDLSKLQEQLSTGKRLLRPSDNPVDVANALLLRTKIVANIQYKKNIEDGTGFMSVTDTSMNSMNSLMQRLRELAIQGSSDTMSANERAYMQKETEQLLRQVITLVNTNYKGDYIFGGTQSKIAPLPVASSAASSALDYTQLKMSWYNGSGGVGVAAQLRDGYTGDNITRIIPGSLNIERSGTRFIEGQDFTVNYTTGTITPLVAAMAVDVSDGGNFTAGVNGYYTQAGFKITFDSVVSGKDIYGDPVVSRGDILREVEPDIAMPINITAEELLNDPNSNKNLIDTLINLSQNLLQNNRPGVQASIAEIDISFKNILAMQSKNGARINRLESTIDRNQAQQSESTRLQASLEDADFADVASKFSLAETVYNAALKSAAKVIQPSLADYL